MLYICVEIKLFAVNITKEMSYRFCDKAPFSLSKKSYGVASYFYEKVVLMNFSGCLF